MLEGATKLFGLQPTISLTEMVAKLVKGVHQDWHQELGGIGVLSNLAQQAVLESYMKQTRLVFTTRIDDDHPPVVTGYQVKAPCRELDGWQLTANGLPLKEGAVARCYYAKSDHLLILELQSSFDASHSQALLSLLRSLNAHGICYLDQNLPYILELVLKV